MASLCSWKSRGTFWRNLVATLPAILLLAVSACEGTPKALDYEVLEILPHDTSAYTQGLELHDGVLYESTGRNGASSIRKVDPASGEVLEIRRLDDQYFGEGLAVVDSEVVQLTWKAGVAFVYDSEALAPSDTLQYSGEGWGLCYDGQSLFMTDGSQALIRRDPRTFEVLGREKVTREGISVWSLNELECVGDEIWANVFQSDEILRIDKATGRVTGVLDGYRLSVSSGRSSNPEAVLNGIAYDAESGTFLVTGKLWPRLFRIRVEGGGGR